MSIERKQFSWDGMIEAVEAVRQRALRATKALAQAGIPYAVSGGNAVAAWAVRQIAFSLFYFDATFVRNCFSDRS